MKGRTYWRIVESRRVNGKPRPVPVLYLGTADALLERLLAAPAGRLRLRSFEHGDVAALAAAAERLGVVEIIDRHVPRARGGRSVGVTLLLAAINRAVRPRSKRGFAGWAATTSLPRLFPAAGVEGLTSQAFWDAMERVSLEALHAIEGELARVVVRELGVELDTLFYDTSNFFTYLASDNERSSLARRGRSKQKRADLRLFSLALLVTRDGHIPLLSHVYPGNTVDVTLFPQALSLMRERLAELSVDLESVTVVFDKGNLSKANHKLVDEAPFGFVASLTPAHHPELMAIPLTRYTPLPEGSRLAGVRALRLTHQVWGEKRTVVLYLSQRLRQGQIRGLEQHLEKRLRELAAWQQQLAKPRSGPRSQAAADKRIAKLLAGQHLRQVLRVAYHPDRQGAERLEYHLDEAALKSLHQHVFGKRLLITNRHDWPSQDIILAYRGQSHIEATFRQCKNDEHLAIRPQYHWTDHNIQVHVFTCLLALILARTIEHQARAAGHPHSLDALLERLASIRLAMILHPSGEQGGRPRADWQLETSDDDTTTLYRHLVPHRPPFVYTDGTP